MALTYKNPDLDDFHEAWHWLREHPLFFYKGKHKEDGVEGFDEALTIFVDKVNPKTGRIDDDDQLNVQTMVWLEIGPWMDPANAWEEASTRWVNMGYPSHDPRLDVSGPTFETAIVALARRVLERHGDYPEHRTCSHCLRSRPAGPTDPDAEWFCSESCKACGPSEIRTVPLPGGHHRYVSPREYFDCEHWRDR